MPITSKAFLAGLGGKIRQLREGAGLSQAKLAQKARVHVNVVGRVERGSYNPTVLTLLGIAEALGTTVSDLVRTR
jgi:transcriptional regulator with XRE-family HTH domain